ncbi:hypothetical protein K461DRAFT_220051 [Myriangium duriaei CBS 260.36]|uniref:AB hydrolase-1 domain-containing protein n=1 Tax=Myriangium duriaei CBS 260.36 TaxID=1168546 RepID=A0A9P4J9C7_9PEZI|nr:hypothetical protein K461DRAFT_220051 [Myriangium duriaei CBS 260.36]
MASSTLPTNGRLVDIGTHSLALYTHGPEPSSSKDPIVLFVSGVASDALNWQAVVRLLDSSVRSYTYDRLILVGHSWAGVLTHEYIALKGIDQVAGLVLVDANHETHPLVMDVNDPILWGVIAAAQIYTRGMKRIQGGGSDKEEEENYSPSFETLRKKELSKKQPLLADRPVYVIGGTRSRDWTGLYRAGVARGNGNEEQRAHVREMIKTVDAKSEGLMREFLKLSTKSELVFATESGHFVQMTQPEIVVDGVKWVLYNLQTSS